MAIETASAPTGAIASARGLYGAPEPDFGDWERYKGTPIVGESRLLIDGELVESESGKVFDNINPATEEVIGQVSDGSRADMERAVKAARRAFDTTDWWRDHAFRSHCLGQLADAMTEAKEELRAAAVAEIGCTIVTTYTFQVEASIAAFAHFSQIAGEYQYDQPLEDSDLMAPGVSRAVFREAIGVVGAITPWNYPMFIGSIKLGAALAAGCTAVIKPAESSPWSGGTLLGRLAAEKTDIPAGVLNVVPAFDPTVGEVLTTHPLVDAVTFTGSTAVGRGIMERASQTIKKVCLELGGKSSNVILEDADLEEVIPRAAGLTCFNAGQSCVSPTRMLIPRARYDEAVEMAAAAFESVSVGDPFDPAIALGPVNSKRQYDRVLSYIEKGKEENRLVCGGGPADLDRGYFIKPTVFADVGPMDTLAQEEIFGPVVLLIPYDGEQDAIDIANNTIYGLSGAVWGADEKHAIEVARQIRTGTLAINGANPFNLDLPFGGYRQSGLGREFGVAGFEEFLETKSVAWPRH
jgi:aldehyde dehydrogenase (NAD+)